jgi:hypothetical protein
MAPARRHGPNVGLIATIVAVILLGGGGLAYWFLLSPHRYVGTYRLKTIKTMGATIDVDEWAKSMGGLMSAVGMGGASTGTGSTEVLLVLKGNGTGEIQDKSSGGMFGVGMMVPGAAGAGAKPIPVKWKPAKKGIEVTVSPPSGPTPGMSPFAGGTAGASAGAETLTGNLRGNELALSLDLSATGISMEMGMTFVKR